MWFTCDRSARVRVYQSKFIGNGYRVLSSLDSQRKGIKCDQDRRNEKKRGEIQHDRLYVRVSESYRRDLIYPSTQAKKFAIYRLSIWISKHEMKTEPIER